MTPAATVAPKAIEWLSPSSIKNILACAKMHATKSFSLGKIGDMGGLRHRALELYLLSHMPGFKGDPLTLAAAAAQAASEMGGSMDAADVKKAVDQVTKTPEAGLPDPMTILSVEGSGLPDELMMLASSHPDAQPMLHVVIRDKPGAWGPPYGIRMKLDVLRLLDGGDSDDLAIDDFKGWQASYEPGDNDIQALCNFIGACKIAQAFDLKPAKILWRGLAIPSLRSDCHEFWVAGLDSAIATLDQIASTWAKVKATPPETPGKHCGNCGLNGTARCSAWKGAPGPLVVRGQEAAPVPAPAAVTDWKDEFLIEVYEALQNRAGQIQAMIDLVKPEISNRCRLRVIGPPGFKYTTRSQGSSKIEWDAAKLLDLFESWGIDPRPILGVTGSKGLIEDMTKASTNDKLERKSRVETLKGVYEQGFYIRLAKVPLASTDVAGVQPKEIPEPAAVPLDEQRQALGLNGSDGA